MNQRPLNDVLGRPNTIYKYKLIRDKKMDFARGQITDHVQGPGFTMEEPRPDDYADYRLGAGNEKFVPKALEASTT